MGSVTTEIPASEARTKSGRSGADTLENEAIGLDVSVRIHGSQVAAVVLDTTEHVEPFEEDTSTMIVFPRGAVVKLRAQVRAGHAVVLTNLATQQTAVCRIIQVNSTGNAVHYVKLEFSQPEPGFWSVHFPSDDPVSAEGPSHGEPSSKPEISTVMAAPALDETTKLGEAPSSRADSLAQVTQPHTELKPLAHEPVEPAKPAPAPVNYAATAHAEIGNEIVPLAATPTKRAPAALKTQPTPAPQQRNRVNSTAEAPIFDSLSTGEEIFGKEPSAVGIERTPAKSDTRSVQAFGRSLDSSPLLPSVEIPKRHTGLKIFLSAAAVIIIGAGAAFYVKQYRGNAGQNVAVGTPAPASTLPVTTATSSSVTSPAVPAASQTPVQTEASAAPAPNTEQSVVPPQEQPAITVTPVHNASRNATTQSQPTVSSGLANIYAGDLTARPHALQRRKTALQAPLPSVGSAPGNLVGTPASADLGSLVGGSTVDNSALPKPAEPKTLVRGGLVTQPRLIRTVQPAYPVLATTNRVEGDVQIEALIDQNGKVVSTKVLSGPVLLRHAATDAVQQWRYSPALLDGKPIAMEYKVTVSFRLGQ